MVDKSKLARLARQWKSQEIDKVIYNTLEHYKPPHFTCWELHKAINHKKFNEPLSYHSLNYHLRELEKKGYLKSKIVVNKNNRKERRFIYKKGKYNEIVIPKYLEPKYPYGMEGYSGKGDQRVEAHRKYNKLTGKIYDESYYCKLCGRRHLSKKSKIWWDHREHGIKKKQHAKISGIDVIARAKATEKTKLSPATLRKTKFITEVAKIDKDIAKHWEDAKKGKMSISALYKIAREKYTYK